MNKRKKEGRKKGRKERRKKCDQMCTQLKINTSMWTMCLYKLLQL